MPRPRWHLALAWWYRFLPSRPQSCSPREQIPVAFRHPVWGDLLWLSWDTPGLSGAGHEQCPEAPGSSSPGTSLTNGQGLGCTWEPGGTAGCRRGRPECASCSPTGLGAQACKASPCLPADPRYLKPPPGSWSSGPSRGQVTPGRALALWVLSTVGGQERLCPSERRLWALGAVGSKGPAAAGREGTTRAGPRLKGLRGGAGGLRTGSLPLLQSRPRLEPPELSAPAQACCPPLTQNKRVHPAGLWWEPEGTPQARRKQRRSSRLLNRAVYVESAWVPVRW